MARLFLTLLWFVLPLCPLWAAKNVVNASPSALKILDDALDAIQAEHQTLHGWQYLARLHSEQYDADGKVIGSGDRTVRVRPGANPSEQIIAEATQGQLSFLKDDKSQPKSLPEKKTVTNTDSTPSKKPKIQPADEPKSLDEAVKLYNLRERYLWTRLPDTYLDGVPAYVLAFEPQPKFPARTSAERFCSRIGGTVWISRTDDAVLRVDATLLSPHPLFWIIATLEEMQFNYLLLDANGEKFRPSLTKARIKVTLPFKTVRQLHTIEMDGYERITN